ncbi:MAG TPA: PIG-L family deacetylase [Phycisphaerales bacterium]|nr:PIG-L family deacetylase [Phycisphaerales bacterium]
MANILIIAPHPDDAEIGMGGTIAALAEQGHNVLIADMTDGSPTPFGDRSSRLIEAAAALRELAPSAAAQSRGGRLARIMLDLPNRTVTHSIEARHKVAGVIRAHQANVLFMPHPLDAHPDHIAVTRIAEDARFDAKLTKIEMPTPPGSTQIGPPIYPSWVFYYYCSHLRRVPDPHFVFDTTGFSEKKIRSVMAYTSQFGPRPGLSQANAELPDQLAAHDRYMGTRIRVQTAEPFWTKEPLGLSSLASVPGIAI